MRPGSIRVPLRVCRPAGPEHEGDAESRRHDSSGHDPVVVPAEPELCHQPCPDRPAVLKIGTGFEVRLGELAAAANESSLDWVPSNRKYWIGLRRMSLEVTGGAQIRARSQLVLAQPFAGGEEIPPHLVPAAGNWGVERVAALPPDCGDPVWGLPVRHAPVGRAVRGVAEVQHAPGGQCDLVSEVEEVPATSPVERGFDWNQGGEAGVRGMEVVQDQA